MIPLFISRMLAWTGLASRMSAMVGGTKSKSTLETIAGFTSNKDLQTIMCYCWGDYGTQPSDSGFSMHTMLLNHFSMGSFYPVGGPSEIAFNIIPVIERSGGRVLVNAKVEEILHDGSRVVGVAVRKTVGGGDSIIIKAPLVVSGAGLRNTFMHLLPSTVASRSELYPLCENLKPGVSFFSVFVGLSAPGKELDLKKRNVWHFASNNVLYGVSDYLALSRDEALNADIPLMFISFPSIKNPNWGDGLPQRKGMSTMVVIAVANWEWFEEWEDSKLGKRGEDYEAAKKSFGNKIVEQCCLLFPQIKSHIDYVEVGSPLSNRHYLDQPRGEIYGLDHSRDRFTAANCARLRPETDVPGLYMTGQDVLSCGFTGAMVGGVIAAGSILGRNVMADVKKLIKQRSKMI